MNQPLFDINQTWIGMIGDKHAIGFGGATPTKVMELIQGMKESSGEIAPCLFREFLLMDEMVAQGYGEREGDLVLLGDESIEDNAQAEITWAGFKFDDKYPDAMESYDNALRDCVSDPQAFWQRCIDRHVPQTLIVDEDEPIYAILKSAFGDNAAKRLTEGEGIIPPAVTTKDGLRRWTRAERRRAKREGRREVPVSVTELIQRNLN